MCPPTWAVTFTDDRILTRSASGNQAGGQNSKDLPDKVNNKRGNRVLSALHLKTLTLPNDLSIQLKSVLLSNTLENKPLKLHLGFWHLRSCKG